MLTLNRILHPTDFSAVARAALDYAIDLALHTGADLHILHADDGSVATDDRDTYVRALLPNVRDRLQVGLQAGRKSVTATYVERRGSDAAGVILAYAAAEHMDLIVLGTDARRSLRRVMGGHITTRVVREARSPVLSVPGRMAQRNAALQAGPLLVPVDFSIHSARAIAHARELAALLGTSCKVLHVIDRASYPELYTLGLVEQGRRQVELEGSKRLDLQAFYDEIDGPEVESSFFTVSGEAEDKIAALAEAHAASMVIMGSHGRSKLNRLLLGSVAEAVIRTSGFPVWTVRVGPALATRSEQERTQDEDRGFSAQPSVYRQS